MKILKSLFQLSLLLILFTLGSCQKDIDSFVPDNNIIGQVINPSPVEASVSGVVLDEANNPVSGASVKSGTYTTTTDSRGLFRFSNISMDKYASVVIVEGNGYFKGIRTFSATNGSSNYIKIKLIRKTLAGTVDAGTGGAVTLPNNSIVTLQPASVVVKSTGQVYAGTINVYAAYIDPSLNDITQTIPGSFQATDANNFRVLLKSYAMLAVQLEGQSGELLQIETGKTARLRFTIPSSLSSEAPATMPLWSLNETDGLWKEEGTATKTGSYYEGDVSHFSFWNCDQPFNAVYLELTLNTATGPLPGTAVKITRVNNGAYTCGYTDSTGHVGGLVFSNEPLLLEILSECFDPVYSQDLGSLSQNTDLGLITVPLAQQYSLEISGDAVDCNSLPVTSGTALIFFENTALYVPISNGHFSTTITRCNASAEPVEIIVADNTTLQQGNVWTGSAATGVLNTGTLIACGVTTDEYIHYTINGIDHNLDIAPHYFYQSQLMGSNVSTFGGYSSSDSVQFSMDYTNIAAGSSQQLFSFHSGFVQSTANSVYTFVPTANITISEFGSVGEFITGSFPQSIMTVSDGTTVNDYIISGSFRIRRTF